MTTKKFWWQGSKEGKTKLDSSLLTNQRRLKQNHHLDPLFFQNFQERNRSQDLIFLLIPRLDSLPLDPHSTDVIIYILLNLHLANYFLKISGNWIKIFLYKKNIEIHSLISIWMHKEGWIRISPKLFPLTPTEQHRLCKIFMEVREHPTRPINFIILTKIQN